MKTIITILLSVVYIATQAQTKIIAHKSHSGSNTNFSTAYSNDLFDMDEDNLGMAPNRYEIKKEHLHPQLDSVIFVSEQKVILVTSNVCTMENIYSYKKQDTKEEVWTPGKEIATNHPLFSKQHSLDSIKNVLKSSYGFENPIENVVFVGYDNKKETKLSSDPLPEKDIRTCMYAESRKKQNSGKESVLVVLGLALATFFSGMFMLNRNN